MLIIEYDPTLAECAVPDAEVQSTVNARIAQYFTYEKLHGIHYQHHIVCCNELVISAYRVAVKKGILPHDRVRFKFNQDLLPIDKDGRLPMWPQGFCDYSDGFLDDLL